MFREKLDDVLTNSISRLSEAQRKSAIELLERVANINSAPSAQQREFIDRVRNHFAPQPSAKGTWA